ncbi:prolipoprotein diacylglyceryl transferase [Acetobacter oeni]|uniref:Phosphatidylglycerol--prolipoprotein diacylglyceryl transferase n=1 Tax=Acetobacter oeni TaxID=304077 RepID=A0A511XGZ3_9PROT|nr:prolipoprotein diacylglyceryl transferase [Acetobacter oeni]MBB3882319.1 phosphatidylglycerol:prolipoprotein diacylglycerol transferase [Acetobacter oeni]NHO18576.1 prolipoprotein diacylglyceryl transferase [Acetobacter oeni]GBR02208.1 prolipoprotein diacylglyceryl transferase [Acetobacter oeni LMG 21952]GEN62181.1 prolipoprotein diacylglyceryl transferase [Acetobacter oeni]
MLPVLIFPQFDPVLIHLGPLAIRWYALAYIAGIILGLQLLKRIVTWAPRAATVRQADDFLTWVTLGVVIGGRLGYVLFYQPSFFLTHPLAIPQVWKGGMSFHGGAAGVIIALILFARRYGLSFLAFSDRVTVCVPIGLCFGRIANFINGELWGRAADPSLPWAMIFPDSDGVPRHPSEIYEALTEGLLLFLVLLFAARKENLRARPGFLAGLFLAGYGCARIFCEFFREPDAFLGYFSFGVTMGQILSIPMILAGIGLMVHAFRSPEYAGVPDDAVASSGDVR